VRIFKNKWFHRFTCKEDITDGELKDIVKQLEKRQYYADLGGSVYKMELARKGEGKHGGFRTIVVFKSDFRSFFIYGFQKSKMDNINQKALKAFKEEAKDKLTMTDVYIEIMKGNNDLIEILQEEENEIRK
jgi:hypothetical protein